MASEIFVMAGGLWIFAAALMATEATTLPECGVVIAVMLTGIVLREIGILLHNKQPQLQA